MGEGGSRRWDEGCERGEMLIRGEEGEKMCEG